MRRDKEGCGQGKHKPQRLSCAWRLLRERARGEHDPHRAERLQHRGCTGIGAANRGDVGKLAGEEPEDAENDEAPKRGSIAQHRNKALAARRKQQHQEQRTRAEHTGRGDEGGVDVVVREQILRARTREAPERTARERAHHAKEKALSTPLPHC